MGWCERGKKGVHTGRTLRRNTFTKLGLNGQKKTKNNCFFGGVFVKHKNNTTDTAYSAINPLLDRYGLTDGLDLDSPNDHGIEYSLGKRKRWLLVDLVKERVEESEEEEKEVAVEEQDENEPHVCFQTRYMHGRFQRSSRARADCVSIYSDHDGESLPKHKYSFYNDIRQKEKSLQAPEICYEIGVSPPPTSWPNFSEIKHAKLESSSHSNESRPKHTWKRVGKMKSQEWDSPCEDTGHTKVRLTDCKVKTVDNNEFLSATQNMASENQHKHSYPCRLDDFVVEKKKQGFARVEDKKLNAVTGIPKYGKGCAVYVDPEQVNTDAKQPSAVPQQSDMKSQKVPKKCSITINIDSKDFEAPSLIEEWGRCFSEASVTPRKLAINLLPLLPKNHPSHFRIANVVFEEQNMASDNPLQVTMAVKLFCIVTDCTTMTHEATEDFVSYVTRTDKGSRIWKVREVVKAALQCVAVLTGHSPDESTVKLQILPTAKVFKVPNLNFLNEICGWQSEAFSGEKAKKQIIEKINNEEKNTKRSDVTFSQWPTQPLECGICFEQFEDNDLNVTSLKECGHPFCKECWVNHIETQVAQGMEQLKCPGYDCDCKVDSISVLCLVPELYERYLNIRVNKYLERSPEWKWCPGKNCHNIVKAAADSDDGLTVLCNCQHAWCFKCKKPSHWPASCAESEDFIKKCGNFSELISMESDKAVKSVFVKNCPKCEYPIEKFEGCFMMRCVLCDTNFCWNCLAITSYGHGCEKKPDDNITRVILNTRNIKYEIQKYLNIILQSITEREASLVNAKGKKIISFRKGLVCNPAAMLEHAFPLRGTENSQVTKTVRKVVENKIQEIVQEALEFVFQGYLTLEGFSQKAAVSRYHVSVTSQLAFVLGRINIMLQEPAELCKGEKIRWLKRLVDIGKDCVRTMKRYSSKSQH